MEESRNSNKEYFALYYEKLAMNAQKGETFFIKFNHDPVIYRAIPLIHDGFDHGKDQKFLMKVLEPESHKGLFFKQIKDIEMFGSDPWSYND